MKAFGLTINLREDPQIIEEYKEKILEFIGHCLRHKNPPKLKLHFPGGGGFGCPAERDRAAIENDICKGYISLEAAKKHYNYQT